jgi:hypothetical protein
MQEMKDLVEEPKVRFLVTEDKNGKTNVSPKVSIYVVDDGT